MSDETPARDLEKFMLRMPEGMRERIAREAKANGRSMNAELIARIEKTFDEDGVIEYLVSKIDHMQAEFDNRLSDVESDLHELKLRVLPESHRRD